MTVVLEDLSVGVSHGDVFISVSCVQASYAIQRTLKCQSHVGSKDRHWCNIEWSISSILNLLNLDKSRAMQMPQIISFATI